MATTKAVSQAKPKKATATDRARAAVQKMRQATLAIPMPEPAAEIVLLPLELIQVQAQVRTEFNDETIRELAEDIAERGVIQPILVRAIDGGYLIVAGERRYRAAKLAELQTIPAIVSSIDDETAAAVQIAENIQREDLSLADTAKAVRRLYEIHGNSVTVTAAKLHKSKAWVSKHLSASCPKLNIWARELLEDGATEDLEIVLTIDKISALDYWKAKQVADQVRAGKAGRQSVRDALKEAEEEVKKDEAERQQFNEQYNTPEAIAERERLLEQQRIERDKAEATARLDPMRLRWKYHDKLEDDQREALSKHLEQLHTEATDNRGMFPARFMKMIEHGDYTNIELAAYVWGHDGYSFSLEGLIRFMTEIEEKE